MRFAAHTESIVLNPIFDSQPGNALEFFEIVGDQSEPLMARMRCDEKVEVADRGSGSLKVCPDLAKHTGSF